MSKERDAEGIYHTSVSKTQCHFCSIASIFYVPPDKDLRTNPFVILVGKHCNGIETKKMR